MLTAVLERLGRLHPQVIDLSLDRMWRLLAALGNPQDHLPPVVHVAGTNGKGSTLAVLRAVAEAAGMRVHVYTSPHLVRFGERIVLAGQEADDATLLTLLNEVEQRNEGQPITFFESTTAAALLAFSRVPADLLLLETGLGGRLDATNVIARPAVTVITPLDLDHQEYLGSTQSAIAGEKAGIIKDGVPCISARQPEEALTVLRAVAAERHAPLRIEGEDFAVEAGGGFLYRGFDGGITSLPVPALPGEFQKHNAAVGLATAEVLGLPSAVWADALQRVRWPARLQRLSAGPLPELLPEGWELWLDGGHNPHAGRALAAHAAACWADRPLHVLFGVLNTKDGQGLLTPLVPYIRSLYSLSIPGESRSLPAAEAAALACRCGVSTVKTMDSLAESLRHCAATQSGPARVLICGSLYLAGHVLRQNQIAEEYQETE